MLPRRLIDGAHTLDGLKPSAACAHAGGPWPIRPASVHLTPSGEVFARIAPCVGPCCPVPTVKNWPPISIKDGSWIWTSPDICGCGSAALTGAGSSRARASPSAPPVLFREPGRTRRPCPSALLLDHHLSAPDPPQNVDRNIRSVALQEDIDSAFANGERANDGPIEKVRQCRAVKTDLLRVAIELEAQTSLQQRQRRSARPGLRGAGHRIERWALAEGAREAAKQFRRPTQVHIARSVKETRQEPLSFLSQSISSKAEADQRVVVRPDRAVVVGHRIVARFGRGDRPDAPAREEVRTQQLLSDRRRSILRNDAGEQ